jgi:hypothetical protein
MASIRPLKRKGGTKCRVFIRRKGKQPVSKVFDLKSDARKWAPVDVIDAFMLDYRGKDTAIVGRLSLVAHALRAHHPGEL